MSTQICFKTIIYVRLDKGKRTAPPEPGGSLGGGPLSIGGELIAIQAVFELL